jgi:RsiW-degrading membrane proteinase PrsW (M82 family)
MIARAAALPLTHAVFASIWGHALSRAKHDGTPLWRAVIPALALSALVHGVYDFVAVGAHVAFRPVTAAIVLAIWIWRMPVPSTCSRQTSSTRRGCGVHRRESKYPG